MTKENVNIKLFKKQQRRLKGIIRRGVSNGYRFNEKLIEAIERTPKRITRKSVERLEKLEIQ